MEKNRNDKGSSTVFKVGAIALAFLILGYQTALFVHKAAALHIEALRDRPDTVYVIKEVQVVRSAADSLPPQRRTVSVSETRAESAHSPAVQQIRERTRKVENFRFNPNTASAEDFRRLGFSEKQAASILNYRAKGGRFHRKEDFSKSFVVADSVYRRLEPYIDIPLLDINKADSAAFDDLPGIGAFFAAKMVEYREELGAYTSPEQLMDIQYFDRERYDKLSDLIYCGGDDGK